MYNVSLSVSDLEDIWDNIIEKVNEYTYDLELVLLLNQDFYWLLKPVSFTGYLSFLNLRLLISKMGSIKYIFSRFS